MFDMLFDTANLVYCAMVVSFAGFVLTNQISLRSLLLVGSGIYITYYYVHTPEPQYSAMISSAIVASANVYGLVMVLMSRMSIFFTAEQKRLYAQMPGLEPGEFRKLLKAGRMVRNSDDAILTREGATPTHVFFIFEGRTTVRKGDAEFRIPPGSFVGEVSFMLSSEASATCIIAPGGTYLQWERDALGRLLVRQPRLRQAFEAQLGRDMARKVASGILREVTDVDADEVAIS